VIWERTRHSHRHQQNEELREVKQSDLDMLEWAAAVGEICLKYLDESGFCQWSPVGYSYYFRGQQKRQEQSQSRGRRLSILGFWEPQVSFEYGLAIGSFKGSSYIRLMDWQAQKAAHRLAQRGQITVIVQDNGSLHTCKLVQEKWTIWHQQGIVPFWLPPYCSEM
jgi:putative transposase